MLNSFCWKYKSQRKCLWIWLTMEINQQNIPFCHLPSNVNPWFPRILNASLMTPDGSWYNCWTLQRVAMASYSDPSQTRLLWVLHHRMLIHQWTWKGQSFLIALGIWKSLSYSSQKFVSNCKAWKNNPHLTWIAIIISKRQLFLGKNVFLEYLANQRSWGLKN